METIDIDDEVYAFLCSQIRDFRNTPNTTLRRLLDISGPGEHQKQAPGPRRDVQTNAAMIDAEEEPKDRAAPENIRTAHMQTRRPANHFLRHLHPGEALVWSSKATDALFFPEAVKLKLHPPRHPPRRRHQNRCWINNH